MPRSGPNNYEAGGADRPCENKFRCQARLARQGRSGSERDFVAEVSKRSGGIVRPTTAAMFFSFRFQFPVSLEKRSVKMSGHSMSTRRSHQGHGSVRAPRADILSRDYETEISRSGQPVDQQSYWGTFAVISTSAAVRRISFIRSA